MKYSVRKINGDKISGDFQFFKKQIHQQFTILIDFAREKGNKSLFLVTNVLMIVLSALEMVNRIANGRKNLIRSFL